MERKVEAETQKFIDEINEIYESILIYIDNPDPISESDYKNLLEIFNKYNIERNQEQLQHIISLLVNISTNHHRQEGFFTKIERILIRYRNQIQSNNTNIEIYKKFESSKRLVYFLIKEGMLQIDETITRLIQNKQEINYSEFFIKEIGKKDENEIDFDEYDRKRQIGENDSEICSLIRQDSVEEFITYVNQKIISLSSTINPSIFETNSFLIDKNPTLIEYATFFGSIQIFKYLCMNGIEVKDSLWFYAIHSNNSDLIGNYIGQNFNHTENDSLEKILFEAIKCNHNDIAFYIKDNLIDMSKIDENQFNKNLLKIAFDNNNYSFFPSDFNENFAFFNLCKYGYYNFCNLLVESQKDMIENKIIRKKNFSFL